ncbi:hypothetical protein [Spiroplasma endosymbiont of Diplazon laetatorius]|uniref:hypothetical protein n=1 Tax=Spiroplasma endosymbiont of Diplazon laetatorius TaxID=3066322 RepID=UPI0030CBF427
MFKLWDCTSFEDYLNNWPSIANKFDKLTNYQKKLGYKDPKDYFEKNAFAAQELANNRVGNILEKLFSTLDLPLYSQEELKKFTYKAIDYLRLNDLVVYQNTRTSQTSYNNGRSDSLQAPTYNSMESLVGSSAWRSWTLANIEKLYLMYCDENEIPFLLDPDVFYNKKEIDKFLSELDKSIQNEHEYTNISIKKLKENQKLFQQETDQEGNVTGEVKNLGYFENILIRSKHPDSFIEDENGEKTAVINLNEQIGEIIEASVYQTSDKEDKTNAIGRIWGSQIEKRIDNIYFPGEIKLISKKINFYTLDSEHKRIIKVDNSGKETIVHNLSFKPSGLYKEDNNFYLTDFDNKKIIKVDNSGQETIIQELTFSPIGIYKEDEYFYTCNYNDNKIIKVDNSGQETIIHNLSFKPYSFCKENNNFYLTDFDTNKITKVDNSGQETKIYEFKFKPAGIYKEDEYFYISDVFEVNKRIIKYNSNSLSTEEIFKNLNNIELSLVYENLNNFKNWVFIGTTILGGVEYEIYQYQPEGYKPSTNFTVPYWEQIYQEDKENKRKQKELNELVKKSDIKPIEQNLSQIKPVVENLKAKDDYRMKKLGIDPTERYWEGDEDE